MNLGIYLPTYRRPGKLQAVATNIELTTRANFKLYFGCEASDIESIEAAKATGHEVVINAYDPAAGYSNTVQTIYEQAEEEIFFHANDDFKFLDGWDVEPMIFMEQNPEVMVLGAHDGNDSPSYSTISFIRREYIKKFSGVIDMPERVFYPYGHNYQDTEFTLTAQARGLWDRIETPCIKHNRTGGDETYRKNEATSPEDARTFASREHLWTNINKEDYMSRKPLTDEQKKNLSDKAKARAAAKREALAKVVTSTDSRPIVKETGAEAMAGRAVDHISEALKICNLLRHQNLDMIEATQAADALGEAIAKMGQVEGLLLSKK